MRLSLLGSPAGRDLYKRIIMIRKRKSTNLVGIAVFVVLVIVTGYILAATDNFDNPFDEIAFLQGAGGMDGQFAAPDADANFTLADGQSAGTSLSSDEFQLPPDSGDTGFREMDSISWSQLGSVFFDLWFLCAVTAVVIVVQQVLSAGRNLYKSRFAGVPA
jgi:hypothetical protein